MYFFVYSTILISITSFSLGWFVYLKNRKAGLNISWGLMSTAVALWSFGLAMLVAAPNVRVAEIWLKIHYSGCILIPPTFLHFVLSFLNLTKNKKNILKACYFLAFIILFLFFSGILVRTPIPKFSFNFYTVPKNSYFLFPLEFFSMISYAIVLVANRVKQSTGLQKRRFIYILIASLFGFAGGSTTFFPVFNIFNKTLLFTNAFVILYPILITYAIVRYRLMDINVIIRETAVFAGIFGFAVGSFVLVMYIGQTFLESYITGHPLFFPVIALFLVTIAVRPIEKLTYNTVGKFLFKKRQKYQKALKDAAEGMASVRKPDRLLGLITHILSKNLNPANVAVYIFDEEEKAYFLRAARYPSKIDQRIEFSSEEAIITWLKENRQPIVLEEIEHWLREEQLRPHKEVLTSDLAMIKMRLSSLGASICIPSFYHKDELLGLLVLGDKKTGDLYTQDDLELLNSLADEAAFAIRNSILYRKLQKKADEISKIYEKEQTMFAHAAAAFANAIDARDPYTHGHSQRVTGYCMALVDQMEESRFGGKERYKWFKQRLNIAGLLHDIGKIAIPDNILQKKGKLNDEEWEKMKQHPVIGAKVLGYVRGLWDIVSAVRHHHERYDGGGYPDGLKEESIPFMSRVMAVADTFDAMTSNRPYRKAMTAEVTKQEINNNSTTQFDPYVVGAFMKAYAKSAIKKIMRQNR